MQHIFFQRLYKLTFLFIIFIAGVSMTSTDSLTLYVKQGCPYCERVTTYMHEHHIEIKTKDVSSPEVRDELIAIGGKKQVPCLVHDGKALYESEDIIKWLRKNIVESNESQ